MILTLLLGCNRSIEPGFEAELVQGWVCEGWGMMGPPDTASVPPVFYVGLDADEHFRVQVELPEREAAFSETASEAEYFRVYTGAHLVVDQGEDKCDDVSSGGFPGQRLDHVYTAISGTVTAFPDGTRTGLTVEGIVLHADDSLLGQPGAPGGDDLPDVTLADGDLPSF
jgi:hypothetical protein